MMDIEKRIGVQTLLQKEHHGELVEDIILTAQKIHEAGFESIEIVPGQRLPEELRDSAAAVYLRDAFGDEQRMKLRDALAPFEYVTVHGTNLCVGIDGDARSKGETLWSPLIELIRFGRDIGADLVTFHGMRQRDEAVSGRELADLYVRFGEYAAGYASEWDIRAGFEISSPSMPRIEGEDFGVLFDTGHCALRFPESPNVSEKVLEDMEACLSTTLEYHYGGVNATPAGLREHRPVDAHDILDNERMIRLLKSRAYAGLIIFEIFFKAGETDQLHLPFRENLEVCLRAKQKLIALWEHS